MDHNKFTELFSKYGKAELFAEAQPYEFIDQLKTYLNAEGKQVENSDIYFFDDGSSAGIIRFEETDHPLIIGTLTTEYG